MRLAKVLCAILVFDTDADAQELQGAISGHGVTVKKIYTETVIFPLSTVAAALEQFRLDLII